jgi:hypothetical protein
VPATVDLVSDAGPAGQEPAAGLSFSIIAAYLDSVEPTEAMLTFALETDLVKVTP